MTVHRLVNLLRMLLSLMAPCCPQWVQVSQLIPSCSTIVQTMTYVTRFKLCWSDWKCDTRLQHLQSIDQMP